MLKHMLQVKKWDEKSNEAMRFARGKTMEMDDVIPYLVPSFMTYIPGLVRLICYLQNKHFISKYGEGDYKITLSKYLILWFPSVFCFALS